MNERTVRRDIGDVDSANQDIESNREAEAQFLNAESEAEPQVTDRAAEAEARERVVPRTVVPSVSGGVGDARRDEQVDSLHLDPPPTREVEREFQAQGRAMQISDPAT